MIVDYWYNSDKKAWVVQRKNNRGDQIGDSDYVYTEREAKDLVKYYNEKFDREYQERKPFLEFANLPKVFVGDVEINPRDLKIGKLKKSRRVTKFARVR